MTTTISGSNGIVFPDATSMQTGQQAVKAWVNFDGTGTVSIRAGYNVSSITDNSTGNYNINFTTAFANTDYAVVGSCQYRTTVQTDQATRSTSSVNVSLSVGASGTSVVGHLDKSIVAVAVFN